MWSPKMTKEQFLDKFSKKSRLSRVQNATSWAAGDRLSLRTRML